MFDPSWDESCPSCSAMADELSEGVLAHLGKRSTTFAAVSRAPYPIVALGTPDKRLTRPGE